MVTVAEWLGTGLWILFYIGSKPIGHPNALVAQRKSARFLPGVVVRSNRIAGRQKISP